MPRPSQRGRSLFGNNILESKKGKYFWYRFATLAQSSRDKSIFVGHPDRRFDRRRRRFDRDKDRDRGRGQGRGMMLGWFFFSIFSRFLKINLETGANARVWLTWQRFPMNQHNYFGHLETFLFWHCSRFQGNLEFSTIYLGFFPNVFPGIFSIKF